MLFAAGSDVLQNVKDKFSLLSPLRAHGAHTHVKKCTLIVYDYVKSW